MLYETTLVVEGTLAEDKIKETLDRIRTYVSQAQGEVVSVEPLGRKRLAYKISGKREGSYFCIRFRMQPTQIGSLYRSMQLEENVLRHVILRLDEKKIERQQKLASAAASAAQLKTDSETKEPAAATSSPPAQNAGEARSFERRPNAGRETARET